MDDDNQQRKRLPQTVTKRSKPQKLLAKLLSPQKLRSKTELVQPTKRKLIKDIMLPLKHSKPMKVKYLLQENKEKSTNEQKMEELMGHGVVKASTRMNNNKTSIKK